MNDVLAPSRAELDIQALVAHHGLGAKAVAVAYFSLEQPDSFIGAHDPDGRITRLIEFLPLPIRGADLLAAIASIDENSPRLVENYASGFQTLHESLMHFYADQDDGETEALGWLFGAASLALGLEQQDLERALAPSLAGVKLDTVVIEQDGRYLFDGRRFLRSLMSYRIAGVAKDVLARSMFESMGDFAGEALQRLVKDWVADAIVCAGDLFAGNNILRVRARTAIIALHLPLHFPPVGRA